jgi:hypothetical protein
MAEKPKKLDQIWSEKDLCQRLDLSVSDKGHSRQIGYWIQGGLKYVEKSGKRYFIEQDVVDYLWGRYKSGSE